MIEEKFVKVSGTGSFLPGDPIPFDAIEDYLGEITQAPQKVMRWIKRTKPIMKEMLDIDYVYYAIDPQTKERTEDHVTMSMKAAKRALDSAHLRPEDIDLITFGSAFNQQMPPISTRIQEALGIDTCAEMAIHSNCTSAYKALLVAHDAIRFGRYKNALVISTSVTSSSLTADFFNQAMLASEAVFMRWFVCDGSGAIVLESSDTKSDGFFVDHTYIESVGGNKLSAMRNGFPPYWINLSVAYDQGCHHVIQLFKNEVHSQMLDRNGRNVFTNGIERMVGKHGIDLSKLRFFQLNMPTKHIVEIILKECETVLGISRNKLYTKISKMGYTGPPAAFICLDKIVREEQINKDDLLLSFVTEVSKFMQAGYTLTYH